jgi:hypothetical protein
MKNNILILLFITLNSCNVQTKMAVEKEASKKMKFVLDEPV